MAPADFLIEVTREGWITREGWRDASEADAPFDLCSHGDIRLEIGGRVISPGDGGASSFQRHGSEGVALSASALALLRTLESDHSPEHPVAGQLILHCEMLAMSGCPYGADWSVTHRGDRVRLHDVRAHMADVIRLPGLEVELASEEYRSRIAAFAEQAKRPYADREKIPVEWERDLYDEFWREYDDRLARATR